MDPGQLDKRVTFRRRALVTRGGRQVPGDYADLFRAWGAWRPLTGRRLVEAGAVTDGIDGTLIVRETARTRGLTVADRVIIAGYDFAIESVPIAHRSGWLSLSVSRRRAPST